MANVRDDAKRLQVREAAFGDDLTRGDRPTIAGAPCLVARTKAAFKYPTAAQVYYACTPVAVFGTEREGQPAELNLGPATLLALNLGTVIPTVGTNVVLTFVDNRWVFRFDG